MTKFVVYLSFLRCSKFLSRVTLEPTTSTDLLKNHHMVKMTLFYLTLTVDLFFHFSVSNLIASVFSLKSGYHASAYLMVDVKTCH